MNIRRLILVFVVMFASFCVSAQKRLSVYIIGDESNTPATIHSAPNGEIVYSLPDTCVYMLDVKKPQNGWWVVEGNSVFGICTKNLYQRKDKTKTS